MKDAKGHGSNARGGLSAPDQHQHKIAVDTVKNPLKGTFLGGPNAAQAESILRTKFGYTDSQINKLKAWEKEPRDGGPDSKRGAQVGSSSSDYWAAKSLATTESPKSVAAPVHSAMSQSFSDISKALDSGYEGPKKGRWPKDVMRRGK